MWENKTRTMKDNEVITGHLSPCVRIFIESLLSDELPESAVRNAGGTETSLDIKTESRKVERPELKSRR